MADLAFKNHKFAFAGDRDTGPNDGYAFTAPVGSFKPNPFGLYDMTGNVWEWCGDWVGKYGAGVESDPMGPKMGTERVMRGGCWSDSPAYCRSALREWRKPDFRLTFLGFRVVQAP